MTQSNPFITPIIIGAVVLVAGPVAADQLVATRGQPIVEVEHDVFVDQADGVFTVRVRRTFENRGQVVDQAELSIDLPPGGVATGLRIKGRDRWYDGELMHAEMAAVIYEHLTGVGPWAVKDPALLFWNGDGVLGLAVFPVLPGKKCTVEYTLVVPAHYQGGEYFMKYPNWVSQPELSVPLLAVAHPDGRRLRIDRANASSRQSHRLGKRSLAEEESSYGENSAGEVSWCDYDGASRVAEWLEILGVEPFCPESGYALISLAAVAKRDPVSARYGVFELPSGSSFARFDVDLAEQLSAEPRQASVVFVIDASRSFGTDGVDSALALARSYASQLVDSRVEVVLFRRNATRLLDRFVPAGRLEGVLADACAEEGVCELGNGSNIERGLELAVGALRGRPGPRRIVVVTDAHLRTAYENRLSVEALTGAGKKAIVHVVDMSAHGIVDGEGAEIVRNDEHDLADVPAAHGGILLDSGTGGASRDYRRVAYELIRPTRIDSFAVIAPDGDELPFAFPEIFDEGGSLRYDGLWQEAPRSLVIQGRLWAEPVNVVVPIDQRISERLTPALLFGTSYHYELDERDLMCAATSGSAVSPVTSYLAIEPGVRPSTAGFGGDLDTIGSGGGFGGLGLRGTGRGGGGASEPDWAALIEELAREVTARCSASDIGDFALEVEIETTMAEVVDVIPRDDADAAAEREFRECVVEALWTIELPPRFEWLLRYSTSVTFPS